MSDSRNDRQGGDVDLDLHGVVRLRVLDAQNDDIRKVERQLGPLVTTSPGDPDIAIRFVDRLNNHQPLTYVGWQESGFDRTGFYLLRGKANVPAKARFGLHEVGGHCQIECERALPAVPLLLPIINLTALAKGVLPLHASAFLHEGSGVLATGWSKGGKTELLLAFMSNGARYVGDEWVYITPDREMFGIPEPIRLWRWQLRQFPAFAARLTRSESRRLAFLDKAAGGIERLVPGSRSTGLIASVLRRAAPVVRRQVNVQVPPARLFGPDSMAPRAHLDRLLFMVSHNSPSLQIDRVDSLEIAKRMRASVAEERLEFMRVYRQFRFAFPELTSAVVEQAEELESALLEHLLSDVPAVSVRHPHPMDIAALYEPVAKVLAKPPDSPGTKTQPRARGARSTRSRIRPRE